MLERNGGCGFSFALLALVGCAAVDPQPDYHQAARYVAEVTGEDQVYRPGADEEMISRRVEELVADGLTAKEAVQITLLNNPGLQAAFFSIGVARADVVQSGLLSNPSLTALVRFPTGGGSSNVEADIVQNLLELWQIPVRKRVATRQLERTILQIAHDASVLAAKTKTAYFSAVGSERALAVEEENLDIIQELLDLTLSRQEAGAATEVDVNVVRSALLEQEIVTRAARLFVFEAKRQLAALEGLSMPPGDLTLTDRLPDPPSWTVSLEGLLESAQAHRLDIRAAREEVEAARENVTLEGRWFLRQVSPGVALESEGSDVAIGPSVELEIPIFDQNQAQIAKTESHYSQAVKLLKALVLSVTQEARGAHERFQTAREMALSYSQRLLPLRKKNLELARESFRLGKSTFLSVLEAQQTYLAARRKYVIQLQALAVTIPDLERVSGQPLSKILAGTGGQP